MHAFKSSKNINKLESIVNDDEQRITKKTSYPLQTSLLIDMLIER